MKRVSTVKYTEDGGGQEKDLRFPRAFEHLVLVQFSDSPGPIDLVAPKTDRLDRAATCLNHKEASKRAGSFRRSAMSSSMASNTALYSAGVTSLPCGVEGLGSIPSTGF